MYQRGFSGGMAHMTDTLRRQGRFSYIRKHQTSPPPASLYPNAPVSYTKMHYVLQSPRKAALCSTGCPLLSMSTALLLTGFTLC